MKISHMPSAFQWVIMAVANGPAGPVLAGPDLMLSFKTAHAQVSNPLARQYITK